jgi:hypothetical protein
MQGDNFTDVANSTVISPNLEGTFAAMFGRHTIAKACFGVTHRI